VALVKQERAELKQAWNAAKAELAAAKAAAEDCRDATATDAEAPEGSASSV
jgi:hypothetical protein